MYVGKIDGKRVFKCGKRNEAVLKPKADYKKTSKPTKVDAGEEKEIKQEE